MEGGDEIKGLTQVSTTVLACLAYCYFLVRNLPKGFVRLLAILPVISIFTYVPLFVSSIHFTATISGLISWMCSSKLILFAFDQGPLSCIPSISFSHFIFIACLPIQVKQQSPPHHITNAGPKSAWNYFIKTLILATIIHVYNYRQYIHPSLIYVMYFYHIYLAVELMLAVTAVPARIICGLELEPQFDEPYMSTSLQEFWGRRWNLTNTSLLRLTVYRPIKRICTPIIGRDCSLVLGIFATFLVSGLMHELMYYHGLRVEPTWEVTLFFVLHGVCTCVEISVKKAAGGRWQVHPMISGGLTLSFLMGTTFWLFFPQLLRCGVDVRGIREYTSFVKFIMGAIL